MPQDVRTRLLFSRPASFWGGTQNIPKLSFGVQLDAEPCLEASFWIRCLCACEADCQVFAWYKCEFRNPAEQGPQAASL